MPLERGKYAPINPEYLYNGGATIRETIRRTQATSDLTPFTTGVMLSTAIALQSGDVVNKIGFISGATQAGTPTHWGFALYSNAATPALLAQTADQTSTAWAANTAMELALATAQTITVDGVYWVSFWMAATTVNTIRGANVGNLVVSTGIITGQSILAQTSGTSLTTTAPATITSPTTVATVPYVTVR